MTYFSIYDPDEPIQIKDKKRKNCNFCVGANLDEDVEEPEPEVDDDQENFHRRKSVRNRKEVGFLKKTFFWICGIEHSLNTGNKETEIKHHVDTSIDQDPKWARICDANAVVAIALSGFCVAFFNKYD